MLIWITHLVTGRNQVKSICLLLVVIAGGLPSPSRCHSKQLDMLGGFSAISLLVAKCLKPRVPNAAALHQPELWLSNPLGSTL